MVTIAEFRTRFPEFVDITIFPDERIQLFIDDSAAVMGDFTEDAWCGQYLRAQAYLVAHLLSMATRTEMATVGGSPSSGAISSKSAGGVSVSYGDSSGTDSNPAPSPYNKTEYGLQWWQIKNSCPTTGMGVMVAYC